MTKTGILSILPRVDTRSVSTFDRLYQMIGQNTGNLLFTNAVWNQISGPKERINFTFNPEKLNRELDALVIPAANWLSPHVDFSHLADLVEKLTMPVVLIGIGAQDADYSGEIDIPEGTIRFVRAVAERSTSISVRGEYTRQILKGLGVENVAVTGCPSLYHDFHRFSPPPNNLHVRFQRGLIHATRYSASYAPFARTDSLQRRLFRMAYAEGMDILFQSEPEEMALLTKLSDGAMFDDRLRGLLLEIYGQPDWDRLLNYVMTQGRLFFDVSQWSNALEGYDYVLGTRLHGTIMALNSGVPAVLIHHDSRTREMADFAAIPSVPASAMKLGKRQVETLFYKTDWSKYYKRRSKNRLRYREFLLANALTAMDF
jgi:hypothetical protein